MQGWPFHKWFRPELVDTWKGRQAASIDRFLHVFRIAFVIGVAAVELYRLDQNMGVVDRVALPLMAISGSRGVRDRLPLCPQQATFATFISDPVSGDRNSWGQSRLFP